MLSFLADWAWVLARALSGALILAFWGLHARHQRINRLSRMNESCAVLSIMALSVGMFVVWGPLKILTASSWGDGWCRWASCPGWILERQLLFLLASGATAIAAMALNAAAHAQLGRRSYDGVLVDDESKKGQGLVTGGIYAHVENPMYWSIMLAHLSAALGAGLRPELAAALPVSYVGMWLRVRSERAQMERVYGDAYREYASRFKRFRFLL